MAFPFVGKPPVSDEMHTHPMDDHNWCYGKLRRSPEVVKRGDMYASDNGQWALCPAEWFGQDVGDFTSTPIVSPSNDDWF